MKKSLQVALMLGLIGFCTRVEASNTLTSWGHFFKHGGNLYSRNFDLAGAARPVEYVSTEACPSTHQTRGSRNYTHLHLNHGFPQSVMVNGAAVDITAAKIGLFWDDEYAGYGGIPGTHDMSHNCHGHALKSNTVMSPAADGFGRWCADYVWTAGAGSDKGLDGWCAESNTSHAIRSKYQDLTCTINSVQTPITKIVQTSEKFRDSGIYTKSGGNCTTSITLKATFNFDGSAIAAYTTYNDCRMCH